MASLYHKKGDLDKHISVHIGEKPYQYINCDMAFSQKDINKHLRVHNGESHCNKPFLRKELLDIHISIHIR